MAVMIACLCLSCARSTPSLQSGTTGLNQSEIISAANREALLQGRDLHQYELPKASYLDARDDGTWTVLYQGTPRGRGNYFHIWVNDRTGKCTLVPGE